MHLAARTVGTLAALQRVGKLSASAVGTLWTVVSPAAGLVLSARLSVSSAAVLSARNIERSVDRALAPVTVDSPKPRLGCPDR